MGNQLCLILQVPAVTRSRARFAFDGLLFPRPKRYYRPHFTCFALEQETLTRQEARTFLPPDQFYDASNLVVNEICEIAFHKKPSRDTSRTRNNVSNSYQCVNGKWPIKVLLLNWIKFLICKKSKMVFFIRQIFFYRVKFADKRLMATKIVGIVLVKQTALIISPSFIVFTWRKSARKYREKQFYSFYRNGNKTWNELFPKIVQPVSFDGRMKERKKKKQFSVYCIGTCSLRKFEISY